MTAEFAAFILIHELAHFTGRRDGESIVDNGRGWFDDVFIKPLGVAQRHLNADSYASFAHECRTGSRRQTYLREDRHRRAGRRTVTRRVLHHFA